MDYQRQIDEKIRRLHDTKSSLQKQIDERTKIMDEIKQRALGLGNEIKAMILQRVSHDSAHLERMMGARIYDKLRMPDTDDPQKFYDHLRFSIDHIRDIMSDCDNLIGNLQHMRTELDQQYRELESWLDRADELLS